MAVLACALWLTLLSPAPARAAPPPPAPSWADPDEQTSQNGALLLAWDPEVSAGAREYELQEATSARFEDATTRYRGTFSSWFVSGRSDGTCHFRVRSRAWSRERGAEGAWSEWSAVKTVVVAHHDLRLALGLFGLGALVFAATALTLLVGARRSQEQA